MRVGAFASAFARTGARDQPINTTLPTRFCLRCRYPLDGLDINSTACPECGQPFDLADPGSYARVPQPHERIAATFDSLPRVPRRTLLGVVLGALLLLRVLLWLIAWAVAIDLSLFLCALMLYPLWMLSVVVCVVVMVQNDRIHGLMFNLFVGMAAGALVGVFDGPFAMILGVGVGLVAGFVYEYFASVAISR